MKCTPSQPISWNPEERDKGIYRKLLFRQQSKLKPNQLLPALTCSATVKVDSDKLMAYRSVIGAVNDGRLPILYPHVMMGSAHLRIASHEDYPLRSVGMLHLCNSVIQSQSIPDDAMLHLTCRVAEQRVVDKGLEIDLASTVEIDGQLVWQSISTLLKPGKFGTPEAPSPLGERIQKIAPVTNSDQFKAPADIGKQYAHVSGDYNPIHTSWIAARLFGFRSPIAHGMWTTARSVTAMTLETSDACRLDVIFKGPVFVGSTVSIHHVGDRYDLYCDENPRPVVCARFCTQDLGSLLD